MSKEYIDRSATVDALNKLCDRVCQYSKAQRKVMCGACPLGDAFTVIEDDLPAADVVEVVRCSECKHSYEDIGGLYCSYGVCVDCVVLDDFFCRYGKRKGGDE